MECALRRDEVGLRVETVEGVAFGRGDLDCLGELMGKKIVERALDLSRLVFEISKPTERREQQLRDGAGQPRSRLFQRSGAGVEETLLQLSRFHQQLREDGVPLDGQ